MREEDSAEEHTLAVLDVGAPVQEAVKVVVVATSEEETEEVSVEVQEDGEGEECVTLQRWCDAAMV